MMEITWVLPGFVLKLLTVFPMLTAAVSNSYLHPEAEVELIVSAGSFSEAEACFAGIFRLVEEGVEDVRICRITRIEAPVSGYLVDATGTMEMEGRRYEVFRVGIEDGYDNPDLAGAEFVFLAGGTDETGESFLYPPETGGFVYEHEFLMEREEFLSLTEDFM